MKNNRYFRHDWGARNDPKMLRLVRVKGAVAKAVYWDLIEMLYEEGGMLPIDAIEDVAFLNHLKDSEIARYVVFDSGLFSYDETHFWSERQRRDELKMNELSAVRKEAGRAGGEAKSKQKYSKSVANAKQTSSESVAIKENIINKIKDIDFIYSSSSKDSELCHPQSADDSQMFPAPKEVVANSVAEGLTNKQCQQVADFWNRRAAETGAQYSAVKLVSDKRRAKIRTRWKEFAKLGDPVEVCRTIFTKACESKFMQGDNSHGWIASFDWLFENDKNWAKVYEGNYDNRNRVASAPSLDDMYRAQIEKIKGNYGTDKGIADLPEEQ